MLGVILAGGSSSRMGTDKALVDVAGRPMIEWVADALGAVCSNVVVVGRTDQIDGLRSLPDTQSQVRGPLAGLATALRLDKPVLLLGVDQPFARPESLRRLADLDPAAIPIDGARQVTCATYPASWHVEANVEIDRGGSVQSLLDRLPHRRIEAPEWRSWGEDGRSWFSVDTPADLEAGLAQFGTPGNGWGPRSS